MGYYLTKADKKADIDQNATNRKAKELQMQTLNISQYGELLATPETSPLIKGALEMALHAASKKRIPGSYENMEWVRINSRVGKKRIGSAVHHEVYDVTADGRQALICVREVEGTKYGIKTVQKNYFVLTRHGKGVKVSEASKAVAAKASKARGNLGQALEVVLGKAKLIVESAKPRTGYKLVKRNQEGGLESAWDGSAWTVEKTRVEAATSDHSGGYYYYATEGEAVAQAKSGTVFGNARDHDDLVLVEIEAAGKEYQYESGKRCASRMTITRVMRDL